MLRFMWSYDLFKKMCNLLGFMTVQILQPKHNQRYRLIYVHLYHLGIPFTANNTKLFIQNKKGFTSYIMYLLPHPSSHKPHLMWNIYCGCVDPVILKPCHDIQQYNPQSGTTRPETLLQRRQLLLILNAWRRIKPYEGLAWKHMKYVSQ